MSFWLQYVPHARIAEFEANGWRVVSSLRQCHHGVWSVLMRKDEV